jgi:hypothetical protein
MGNGQDKKESSLLVKVVTYGGIAILAAIAGALIHDAIRDDEDRPPIIVQNGTVFFQPAHAIQGDWGRWEPIGGSGSWKYVNDIADGPTRLETSAFNGTCNGNGWRNSSLTITYTYTDPMGGTTDWQVDVRVTGNALQVDPKSGQSGTYTAGPPPRLNFGAEPGVHLKSVSTMGGNPASDGCVFTSGIPIIQIDQKVK